MICLVEGGRAGSGTQVSWLDAVHSSCGCLGSRAASGGFRLWNLTGTSGHSGVLTHGTAHPGLLHNCRNWDTQCRTDPGWGGPNSLSERHPDVTLLSTVIGVMNFSALDHAAGKKKRHKPICQSQQFWGSRHLVHPVSSAEFLPCSVHTRFRRLYYTDLICVLSPSRAMGSFGTGFLTQLQLHYLGHCLASRVAGTKWWPNVSGRKVPCGPINQEYKLTFMLAEQKATYNQRRCMNAHLNQNTFEWKGGQLIITVGQQA